MSDKTFLWYDLETFGINAQLDRIASFSAIRTDLDMNVIGDPIDFKIRLTPDYLPQPQTVLVHKITPDDLLEHSIREAEAAKIIYNEFTQDGTVVVGYNNIRFDDGFINNLFYRNFYKPYPFHATRWDLMDVMLALYDFKRDCLKWHYYDDGKPSFKLEVISKTNDFTHERPHESLSDVYATISIAKAIKTNEPKFFNFILENRFKKEVENFIDLNDPQPFLHTSREFQSLSGSTTMVLPLMANAENRKIFLYDLRFDPTLFLNIDKYEVRKRLYTKRADLPDETERMHLKELSSNRCPVVLPLSVLTDDLAISLGIDKAKCIEHARILTDNILKARENLLPLDGVVNGREEKERPKDVDLQLYSGFFSSSEERIFRQINQLSGEDLFASNFEFSDDRSKQLFYRYKNRNYPHLLNEVEHEKWRKFCADRLTFPISSELLSLKQFREKIANLANDNDITEEDKKLLDSLYFYGRRVEKTLLKSVITFTDD